MDRILGVGSPVFAGTEVGVLDVADVTVGLVCLGCFLFILGNTGVLLLLVILLGYICVKKDDLFVPKPHTHTHTHVCCGHCRFRFPSTLARRKPLLRNL